MELQDTGFYLEVRNSNTGEKLFGQYLHASARIGRGSTCDVVIDRPFISTQHMDIRQRESLFEVRDLGSQNGIYSGGRRVAPDTWVGLTAPAEFSIGPLKFVPRQEKPTGVTCATLQKHSRVIATGEIRSEPGPSSEKRLSRAYRKLEGARSSWEQEVRSYLEKARAGHSGSPRRLLEPYPKRDWAHLHAASDFLTEGKLHTVLVAVLRDLAPGVAAPSSEDDAAKLIEHVGSVLQALSRAVVSVRHEVGAEVRAFHLDSSKEVRNEQSLLNELLNWQRPLGERVLEGRVRDEVSVLKQMLSASVTAAHALFTSVSPAEVERSTQRRWPSRSSVLWKCYENLYRSKVGEGYERLTASFRELFVGEYKRLRAQNGKMGAR